MEQKVNALMLRAADYNENDKILTLLTAEQGKLSAALKGVKKAGAKLKFAAQPFCFAEYVLARRGDKYTVIGCSETENFYDLRTDVMKFYAASAAAEAALALTYEEDDCREIFYKTVRAYSDMCSGDELESLVDYLVFVLGKSGYAISAEKCPHCGRLLSGEERLRFDFSAGSFACGDCGNGAQASRTTFNVLRRALGRPYDNGYITPDGLRRALKLLGEFFAVKEERELKSLSEYLKLLATANAG